MSRSKKNTAAQVPASDEAMNLVPVLVETETVETETVEVPVLVETETVETETVEVPVLVETVPVLEVPVVEETVPVLEVPVVEETAPVLEVPVEFETETVVVETVPVVVETVPVVVETVPVVVETFTVAVETATVLEVPVVEVSSMPSLVSQLSALNTAAPEVRVKTKTKNENVYGNVKILFNAGKTNKETLAEIHEMYGNTNTTYACIAWYRNKYNKEAKSTKMTVEQLLNQIGCEFGLDQDWIKTKLSLI